MSDFFEKKEENVSTENAYEFSNFDNDMAACGITDIQGFQDRYNELFDNLVVDSDKENPVAVVSHAIENILSIREMSFLMAKDLLTAAYNETREQLKKEN